MHLLTRLDVENGVFVLITVSVGSSFAIKLQTSLLQPLKHYIAEDMLVMWIHCLCTPCYILQIELSTIAQ